MSVVVSIQKFALIVLGLTCLCSSYNFDIKSSVRISGQTAGAFFGYSIGYYEYGNVKSVLIGAPKTGPRLEGAVQQCSPQLNNLSCREIPTTKPSGAGWLGATVISKNGTTLVCAPHANYHSGLCHHSSGSLDQLNSIGPEEYETPLSALGFSAALSQDTSKMYLGAPAHGKDTGRLHFTSNPSNGIVSWRQTLKGDQAFYAYAIATGRVLPSGGEGVVVSIGFHQNSNYSGKVLIAEHYNATAMSRVHELVGYESGDMFGASLAVSDLNGDGRDDIVIGAPHRTDYSQNNLMIETGCVYVYYKSASGWYVRGSPNEMIIKGEKDGGRFGLAVAAIGDANADGFNDLAIGAPYENAGSGSVYLYYGSETGLRNRPSQVISGQQFSPGLKSFGFAFPSAHDLDGNEHADLTVGAYQSDVVVHIPARPVVRLAAELEFVPGYITMERRDCTVSSPSEPPTSVPCAAMNYCLTFSGRGVPNQLEFNLSIILDVKQTRSHRLFFLASNEHSMFQTVQLTRGQRRCWQEKVYVKTNIRDKLSPMVNTLMSKLLFPAKPPTLAPVLDALGENGTASRSLSIFRQCGEDQICTPDLQLKIKTNMDTHYQGSPERLVVDVDVLNAGEDSFGSEFFLHMPQTMRFVSIDKQESDQTLFCYPPSDDDRAPVLRCDIGNPLVAQQSARLRAIFELKPDDFNNTVTFFAEVNSTNPEIADTTHDNHHQTTIDVKAKASLQLTGYSRPETVTVNMSALYEHGQSALPNYTQFFEVQNLGPSDVLATRFRITMRSRTKGGQAIIRVISQPIIEGPAKCQQSSDIVNDQAIILDCSSQRLAHADRIVVRINSQLASDAVLKYGTATSSFNLESTIAANITGMLYNQDVTSIPEKTARSELTIYRMSNEINVLQATPAWIPIVSAIAAIIALVGFTFLLRHFGFFKRNRPHLMTGQVQQQQPEELELAD